MAGKRLLKVRMVKNSLKWLKIASHCRNGCNWWNWLKLVTNGLNCMADEKLLDIPGNGCKWQKMDVIAGLAGYGWIWLEIARNGWNGWKALKWLEIVGNSYK